MPDPVHFLAGPAWDWTVARVACGAHAVTQATWDVTLVTCAGCRALGLERVRPRVTMSEQALQDVLTQALTRAGWLWYHTHDSRHSPAGFPDLTALRGERCLVAEVKSATGLLTPAQQTWLAAWRRIAGVEVHVFRPDDLDAALAVLR